MTEGLKLILYTIWIIFFVNTAMTQIETLFFAAGPQFLQQGLAAQESPVPKWGKNVVELAGKFGNAYRVAETLLKTVQAVFLTEGVHPAKIVEIHPEGAGPADHLRLHGIGGHQIALFIAAGPVNVKYFAAIVQRNSGSQRLPFKFRQTDAAALWAIGFHHALEIIQRTVANAVPFAGFQVDPEECFQFFGAGPAGGYPFAGR